MGPCGGLLKAGTTFESRVSNKILAWNKQLGFFKLELKVFPEASVMTTA
jgi:hypothetical protein